MAAEEGTVAEAVSMVVAEVSTLAGVAASEAAMGVASVADTVDVDGVADGVTGADGDGGEDGVGALATG